MKHKNEKALRWISEGKKVLGRVKPGSAGDHEWSDVSLWNDVALLEIIKGGSIPFEFMLAPRFIKIDGERFEAPMQEVEKWATYWTWGFHECDSGDVVWEHQNTGGEYDEKIISLGAAFPTKEAALAARSAYSKMIESHVEGRANE